MYTVGSPEGTQVSITRDWVTYRCYHKGELLNLGSEVGYNIE